MKNQQKYVKNPHINPERESRFQTKSDAASYTVTDRQNKLRPATQPWSAWAGWINNGKNHLTSHVYDANNRLIYQIDTLGDRKR